MAVKQVKPHVRWPSGDSKPVAVLALTPHELTATFQLVFEHDNDELGEYVIAAIAYQGNEQAWLLHRPNAPTPGVEVHIDGRASSDAALSRLVRLLNLSPSRILWSADPDPGDRVPGSRKAKAG